MRLLMSSTAFIVIRRFLFIGWHGIYSEVFLRRRLLTDFRRGDQSGRCRYPLRLEYVPQISQIYTDFSWDVFLSRRFRRWRRFFLMGFFIHRTTRNLFGDFLLRRLLTDFRGCDLSGRCRYPLRVEYVPQISQIYTDFSCFNFLPFHLFPPFLISHFIIPFYFFTFLPFYL